MAGLGRGKGWGRPGRVIMRPAVWIEERRYCVAKSGPGQSQVLDARQSARRRVLACFLCWPFITLPQARQQALKRADLWTGPPPPSSSASSPKASATKKFVDVCVLTLLPSPPPSHPHSTHSHGTSTPATPTASQKPCRGTPPTVFPSPHSPARGSFSKSSMP